MRNPFLSAGTGSGSLMKNIRINKNYKIRMEGLSKALIGGYLLHRVVISDSGIDHLEFIDGSRRALVKFVFQ
jgi:hypothetical protein